MAISNSEVIEEFKQAQGFRPAQSGGQGGEMEQSLSSELSRGERFDLEQGGGRGDDAVEAEDELEQDQQEHQDRGQRCIDENGPGEGGATEGQQS